MRANKRSLLTRRSFRGSVGGGVSQFTLNFANNSYTTPSGSSSDPVADSLLTVSRANGTSYAENVDGSWSSFAANTLRRTDKGILIERKATTYINNQNSSAAASGLISDVLSTNKGTLPNQWSTAGFFPANLFYQVLAVGTDSTTGFPKTRIRVAGTAAADGTPSIRFMPSGSSNSGSPPAAINELVVCSLFLSHFAGTPAPNLFLGTTNFNGNTTANLLTATDTYISGLTGSDSTQRSKVYIPEPTSTPSPVARYETYPLLRQNTCDNHRVYLQFDVKSGVAYDFTIDIIMPQCEVVPSLESRATSPIYSPSLSTTWSANATEAMSNTVNSATGLQIGMVVWGTGVTYKTVITNIVGTTITFNNPITVTSGGAVRFIGGTREQDVIALDGDALTMAQGSTATLKATVGALGWKQSYKANATKGTSTASARQRPILGLNGSTTLLNHEDDGSISSAYGSGARTFKAFLGNHAIRSNEHSVAWNGSSLALSTQAGGDVMSVSSGTTAITSVQLGTKGDTTALDGYISKLVISDNYAVDSTVGSISADVIVYGAKASGIDAAYRAKAEGRSVAIIGDWREHTVGGMMAGGLAYTDYQSSSTNYTNSGAKLSGTTTFTLTDVTGLVVGVNATRSGALPSTCYITGIAGNDVTLSAASTATIADAATIAFDVLGNGSENVVLRTTTTATGAIGDNTLTLTNVDNWIVGAPILKNDNTDNSIPYGTKITAIDTGTKVVTLSNRLIAALSSGTIVKTSSSGGYGGLSRWVFSRACTKALVSDEAFYCEPRIFRAVFEDMLCEMGIPVYYTGGVDSVSKSGTTITGFSTAARTVGSAVCSAKSASLSVLVAADYEGDFLPKAGISVSKLREANSAYGDLQNGYKGSGTAGSSGLYQPSIPDAGTAFDVDPWVTPATPSSGVIEGFTPIQVLATTGSGSGTNVGDFAYVTADNKVYRWNGSAWALPASGSEDDTALQAYNFRLTITKDTTRLRNIFSGTTGSFALNADTTATNILNVTDTSALAIGYGVFHANIPYGTTITAKTLSTVTINNTVTVASGQTITYLNPADFGFTAARAELHIRTIKAFDDAATTAGRTYTTDSNAGTAGQWGFFDFIQPKVSTGMHNVYDANNQGGIGIDYVGGNKGYLDLSYADRETMWRDHINHCLCQFWVFQFYVDARIRAALQTNARLWGFDMWHYQDALSTEPFQFNPQMYIREGRRMKNADYEGDTPVYWEGDVCGTDGATPRDPKTVGIISYPLDSHQMHRLPLYNAGNYTYWNEGGIGVFAGQTDGALGTVFGTNKRGPIGIDAMVPAASECTNYITSFHGAISHSAFGGFRMEATSMALGEAAGLLAAMAVEGGTSVQSVTYGDDSTPGTFRYRLLNDTPAPIAPVAPLVN
jgi:hypothetical protein